MKTFYVTLPITSTITLTVDADNKTEAKRLAFEAANQGRLSIEVPKDAEPIEVGSWQAHEQIVKGNVFYGEKNEMEIIEE